MCPRSEPRDITQRSNVVREVAPFEPVWTDESCQGVSRVMRTSLQRFTLAEYCLKESVMPPNLTDVEAEAMKLSIEERADLADRLWASLESQAAVDAAWAVEIERRVLQLETGEVDTIPHENVMTELRNKFG